MAAIGKPYEVTGVQASMQTTIPSANLAYKPDPIRIAPVKEHTTNTTMSQHDTEPDVIVGDITVPTLVFKPLSLSRVFCVQN